MNLSTLCTYLPGQWYVVISKDAIPCEISRADGLKLWFREGGYGNVGKIAIHFSRPVGRDGRAPTLWRKGTPDSVGNPSINVSAKKTEAQIAKDIVRRMLTECDAVFAFANERIKATNDHLDGKDKSVHFFAALCGGEPDRHYQTKELTGEIDPYVCAKLPSFKGKGYGKIKVSSDESISLELTSMNHDTATRVISAVAKIFQDLAKKQA